jgi:hypothetical protein
LFTEGESHGDVNNQKDEEQEEKTAKPSQQNPGETSEVEQNIIDGKQSNYVTSSGRLNR